MFEADQKAEVSQNRRRGKGLVANGFKEIVLTGIHVGSFGKTNERVHTLPELISEVGVIKGLYRLRLSSIDPNEVNDALISAIAGNPVACKHLHISLQSGSTRILNEMKRKYTASEFMHLVKAFIQESREFQ